MSKIYIGVDNGPTGSIGVVGTRSDVFIKTPTKFEQNYTKAKGNITRLHAVQFKAFLMQYVSRIETTLIILERPFKNPKFFKSTCTALRCFEAQLAIIESLEFPHRYCDSKEWQRNILPKGTKGAPELKKASLDIGSRLFPQFKELMKKQKDADGILIAENARREKW